MYLNRRVINLGPVGLGYSFANQNNEYLKTLFHKISFRS